MKTKAKLCGAFVALMLIMAFAFASMPISALASYKTTQLDSILEYGRDRLGSTAYSGYCQRFVRECYEAGGLYAPSNASSALVAWNRYGISTARENIPVGACLYFNTSSYGHVGIYTGNGKMLHAVSTVKEEPISDYFWSVYLGWGFQTGQQPAGCYYENGSAQPSYALSSNTSYPDLNELSQGEGFPVRGTITSDFKLDYASVQITDEAGELVITASATPSSFSYNLASFDSDIKFGQLPIGKYRYRIVASAIMDGNVILLDELFNVGYTELDTPSVFAEVNGSEVLIGWDEVDSATSYALEILRDGECVYSFEHDSEVTSVVRELPTGSYTAALTAINNDFWYCSSSAYVDFEVSPAASEWDIAGITYPAMNALGVGQSFGLRGVITSNYEITYVLLTVRDEFGNAVLSADASPNSYSFDIYEIDRYMRFGTLSQGKYVYEIYVENSLGDCKILHSSRFNVGYERLPAPKAFVAARGTTVKISWRTSSNVEKYIVTVYDSGGMAVYSNEIRTGAVMLWLSSDTYCVEVVAIDRRFWDSASYSETYFDLSAPR